MRHLISFLIFLILLSACKSNNVNKGRSSKMKMKSKNIEMSPAPKASRDPDTTQYSVQYDTISEMKVGSAYVESSESSEISYSGYKDNVKNAKIIDKTNEVPKQADNKIIRGLVAYSVPAEMTVGENYSIKIRITKDSTEKKTLIVGDHAIPINDTTVHSTITIESIRVSSVMSAALTSDSDDNFKITSKSTETQNIENFGYTEWDWNVMPLKSGDHNLKLVIKVRITSDEGSFFKDIVVFEKQVPIKSNASYSISKAIDKYWQWSLSTLIIPFFIWLYNRKKKKKEEEKVA